MLERSTAEREMMHRFKRIENFSRWFPVSQISFPCVFLVNNLKALMKTSVYLLDSFEILKNLKEQMNLCRLSFHAFTNDKC